MFEVFAEDPDTLKALDDVLAHEDDKPEMIASLADLLDNLGQKEFARRLREARMDGDRVQAIFQEMEDLAAKERP